MIRDKDHHETPGEAEEGDSMALSESVVNFLFPRKSCQSVTESALTETPGTQRPCSAVNNISGLLSADQTSTIKLIKLFRRGLNPQTATPET